MRGPLRHDIKGRHESGPIADWPVTLQVLRIAALSDRDIEAIMNYAARVDTSASPMTLTFSEAS